VVRFCNVFCLFLCLLFRFFLFFYSSRRRHTSFSRDWSSDVCSSDLVTLILDQSDVEVNVDGNSPQGFAEINGSPDADLIAKVQELQSRANSDPLVAELNEQFLAAARNRDEETKLSVQMKYLDHVKKYNDEIAKLLVAKAPSLAVINLLQSNVLDKDQYFDTYLQVADKLKKE